MWSNLFITSQNKRQTVFSTGPNTDKTASILNQIETNQVKKERYLIRQDNTIELPCPIKKVIF